MATPPKWPNNVCLAVLVSAAGEGRQGPGGLELPHSWSECAAPQLDVSVPGADRGLGVSSMQRLWDVCEATLFTCIYLFARIKLHSASLYPRPPLLFLDSLQKYLKAFIVSSPLPTISLERCWPERVVTLFLMDVEQSCWALQRCF